MAIQRRHVSRRCRARCRDTAEDRLSRDTGHVAKTTPGRECRAPRALCRPTSRALLLPVPTPHLDHELHALALNDRFIAVVCGWYAALRALANPIHASAQLSRVTLHDQPDSAPPSSSGSHADGRHGLSKGSDRTRPEPTDRAQPPARPSAYRTCAQPCTTASTARKSAWKALDAYGIRLLHSNSACSRCARTRSSSATASTAKWFERAANLACRPPTP